MTARDELLARCAALPPGTMLRLAAAEVDAALPACERPDEWSAIAELFGLLSEDGDLRVDADARTGSVTVTRLAAAVLQLEAWQPRPLAPAATPAARRRYR